MTRAHRSIFVTAFALTTACGAATHPDPSAAYASIQIDEASIEHAAVAIANGDAEEARVRELCEASEHLCATAVTIDETDAATRCRHARERCAQVTP